MNTATDKSRRPLGKGLSALLAPRASAQPQGDGTAVAAAPANPSRIAIDAIAPNPVQPRSVFQPEQLEELAASIRANGIIQPLIVRRVGQQYQIVAGERRWRAAKIAGLSEVPVVVQEVADRQMLELALIENIQREDLNPIEEAQAYERLISDFGLTQEDVSRRVGKNRATIANMLRLLRLPPEVQQWLRENRLSTGHAKALLSLSDLNAILDSARKIIQGNYSVRQAEMLVSRYTANGGVKEESAAAETEDPNVKAAIHALEQVLGTKVTVHESGGKGKLEIHFYSVEEMNRLYEGLLRAKF